MEKRYTVVIDTLGCDGGAEVILRGAVNALAEYPELALVLTGDRDVMSTFLENSGADMSRITLVHAPDVITNYDNPSVAIFTKRDSSLVKALETLAAEDDCIGLINAGSTGALLAGSLRYLATPDMQRPALASLIPAEQGGYVCIVDTGATIDCTPAQMLHFARLGNRFMSDMYGIESPKIGLLSNGREEGKGNKLVKEAYALLNDAEDLNFVGNIEGSNSVSGDCDVLVCDGFAGNLILKNTEGIAKRLIKDIVKYSKKTGDEGAMRIVGHLIKKYDFNSLGGAIVLGVRKPIIKAHGAANEQTVVSTTGILLNLAKNKAFFE